MALKLDLHGVKHEDVPRKVIRFIEDSWALEEDLHIITGHSSKMKNIVVAVLMEYKIGWNTSSLDPFVWVSRVQS